MGVHAHSNLGVPPISADARSTARVRRHPGELVQIRFGEAVQALVDGLPMPVAVTAADWRILTVNAAWLADLSGQEIRPPLSIGQNFRNYLQWLRMSGLAEAQQVIDQLDRFAAGDGQQAPLTMPGASEEKHWRVHLSRFELDGVRYTIVSRSNIAELVRLRRTNLSLNMSLMRTESRLVRVHEEERLRLARDLHDTASQHLIGMNLMLAQMRSMATDAVSAKAIADLSDLLGQFHKDLRGLTYLLHPPQIEQHGLHRAVELLCEGFANRTGIHIATRIYGEDRRSNSPAEGAAYRVVQEAMSNVYRHAQAARISLRIVDRKEAIYLSIADDGRGLMRTGLDAGGGETVVGVGIAGMIARVAELGGVLRVGSRKGNRGTMVAACLPRDGGGVAFIPPLRVGHAAEPDE